MILNHETILILSQLTKVDNFFTKGVLILCTVIFQKDLFTIITRKYCNSYDICKNGWSFAQDENWKRKKITDEIETIFSS